MCWLFFFFFKQKTAYEMRISDWSSDVCSSDLGPAGGLGHPPDRRPPAGPAPSGTRPAAPLRADHRRRSRLPPVRARRRQLVLITLRTCLTDPDLVITEWQRRPTCRRSEEHTSELQSLMRISYAVFCLKKKKYEIHST